MDSRAETEGLRTENQSLRNVVQQTNQKLNALISIQMENADRGGDAVNEELRMLRSKTATLEAEIQVSSLQRAHAVSAGTRMLLIWSASSHKSVQLGAARRAGVRNVAALGTLPVVRNVAGLRCVAGKMALNVRSKQAPLALVCLWR